MQDSVKTLVDIRKVKIEGERNSLHERIYRDYGTLKNERNRGGLSFSNIKFSDNSTAMRRMDRLSPAPHNRLIFRDISDA